MVFNSCKHVCLYIEIHFATHKCFDSYGSYLSLSLCRSQIDCLRLLIEYYCSTQLFASLKQFKNIIMWFEILFVSFTFGYTRSGLFCCFLLLLRRRRRCYFVRCYAVWLPLLCSVCRSSVCYFRMFKACAVCIDAYQIYTIFWLFIGSIVSYRIVFFVSSWMLQLVEIYTDDDLWIKNLSPNATENEMRGGLQWIFFALMQIIISDNLASRWWERHKKKTPVQSSTFIIRLTFSNRSKYIESKTTKKYNSNDFGHFSITFCDRQFWQFFILELILLTFYQLMSQSINVNWPIEIDKLWKTNSVLNFLAHVELIKSLKSNLMQVSWLFLFITFWCCDSDVRCGYPFKLTTNVE